MSLLDGIPKQGQRTSLIHSRNTRQEQPSPTHRLHYALVCGVGRRTPFDQSHLLRVLELQARGWAGWGKRQHAGVVQRELALGLRQAEVVHGEVVPFSEETHQQLARFPAPRGPHRVPDECLNPRRARLIRHKRGVATTPLSEKTEMSHGG